MLRPGTRIGGVLIHEMVGRGAMGEVYRGEQVSLRRPVAVKRIAPHLADVPEIVARFEREARLVASLNCPGVVSVYDFGQYRDDDGEQHYLLVMEWVPGGQSLGRVRDAMDWRQATTAIRQVAAGLAVAHEAGVTHRDIKPDNMLLGADGGAKLADFGLATAADVTAMTREGSTIGTPNYMSPEACRSEPLSPSADLYSLGGSWFHLLTGRPPFRADSTMALLLAHVNGQIPDPREHGADVPAPIAELVMACLAKEPAARPESARMLGQRLDVLAAEGVWRPADLKPLAAAAGTPGEPSTVGTEIAADSATLPADGSRDETLLADTAPTAVPPGNTTIPTGVVPAGEDPGCAATGLPGGLPATDAPATGAAAVPLARGRGPLLALAAVLALAAIAAVLVLLVLRDDPLAAGRATVEAALERGDHALAMTTADALIARHPDQPEAHAILRGVVDHEVDELIAEQRYDEAEALIARRKDERSWLDVDDWDQAIRVARVRTLVARGNWRDSEERMWELILDYPTDPALKRVHVELFGADDDGHTSRLAISSAMALADEGTDELERDVGETLLFGLQRIGVYDEDRPRLNRLLAERYRSRSDEVARGWLVQVDDHDVCVHGYFQLEASGALSDAEALRFHTAMLFRLSTTWRKTKETSMAWVRDAMGGADWAERKRAAGITTIDQAPALDSWGEFVTELRELMVDAYGPELEASLLAWAGDTDESHRRWNAYQMLARQGRLDALDPWTFHAATLTTFDFGFTPESFTTALDFFTRQAGGARDAEARAALAACRAYLEKYETMWVERGEDRFLGPIRRNLEVLSQAEAAFE